MPSNKTKTKNLDLICNAVNAVSKCLKTVCYCFQLLPHELVEIAK